MFYILHFVRKTQKILEDFNTNFVVNLILISHNNTPNPKEIGNGYFYEYINGKGMARYRGAPEDRGA